MDGTMDGTTVEGSTSSSAATTTITTTTTTTTAAAAKKTPRTISRRACDACRLRKVKCEPLDEDEVSPATPVSLEQNASRKRPREAEDRPCKACAALPIECTRNMPVKRRGPPNRLAQQAKLLSQSPSASTNTPSLTIGSDGLEIQPEYLQHSPPSPVENKAFQSFRLPHGEATSYPRSIGVVSNPRTYSPSGKTESVASEPDPLSLLMGSLMLPGDGRFDTNVLCSKKLFDRIMNDYIQILQPITPIVHIPTFKADLARQRQSFDMTFYFLTMAICAYTVAALPRKFHEHHASDPSLRFKTRKEMVRFCDKLIQLSKPDDFYGYLTHEKWAIHALLGLAFTHLGVMDRYHVDVAQASSIAQQLGFHKISAYRDLDYIEAQLRKKAFWLDYYAKVHSRILDERWPNLGDRLFFESNDAEQLWPIEVDDEYITQTEILPQPPDKPSLTIGFNANSRIFCCLIPTAKDLSIPILTTSHSTHLPSHVAHLDENYLSTCPCGTSIHLAPQRAVVYALLDKVRYVVEDLPPDLQPWRNDVVPQRDPINLDTHNRNHSLDQSPEPVRSSQFEAMRANIHATHLWAQSVLTERLISLNHLGDSNACISESDAKYIWSLREDICRQLLRVLYNIRQSNLEPNGGALVYKIRQVASTLLDCPFEERSDIARRASDYISEFVGLLARVDGNGHGPGHGDLEEATTTAPATASGRRGGAGVGDAAALTNAMEDTNYWDSIDAQPRTWHPTLDMPFLNAGAGGSEVGGGSPNRTLVR